MINFMEFIFIKKIEKNCLNKIDGDYNFFGRN